jgi:anti-sigma factor RsiW
MICRIAKTKLMDLVEDESTSQVSNTRPDTSVAELRSHVAECAECKQELAELRATMALLDSWEAPEPSPYFNAKMSALLRAEREAAPAGFFERWRARLLFGSNVQFRPVAAGALALLLLIGGGTLAGFMYTTPAPAHTSATVRDLQSLDENSQVFQQLNALDQQDDEADNGPASNSNL